MEIHWLPVSDLKVNPKNPNKHSADQIERLVELIRYYGWRHPIIVSKESGLIVVGHGRLEAAQKMGLQKVPVCIQSFDSPEQEYGFLVADNAIASWSELDLSSINLEVPDLGPDFDIDMLGIKDFEIQAEDKYGDKDLDEIPEKRPTHIKRGDLFSLGQHRLLCGDSTNASDVLKLMNGEKAQMVFTDPPYNTGMSAKENGGSTRLTHMFDDNFSDEDWANLLNGFTARLDESMAEDSVAYVCLDWRRSHELVPYLKRHFKFSNLIIWDKMVHGLGSDYKYTHEFIHVCKKGKPELQTHQGEQEYQDVWHIQRKMGKDDEHATKKPIELVERAIKHGSKQGDIVLDLFLGSGSTLIASDKANRHCFGVELEPSYCQVTIDRWEKLTGLKAVKLEDNSYETEQKRDIPKRKSGRPRSA